MTPSTRTLTVALWVISLAVLDAASVPAANKSSEKKFADPQADKALVYFIREPHYVGRDRTLFLYADEVFLGVLENNSYTFAYLDPGPQMLWQNWARVSTKVELAAGEVYYFNSWEEFDEIDEETGRALIDHIEFFTTPSEKESKKAEKHLRGRYSKAQDLAANKPENEEEFVGTRKKREKHVAKWPHVDLSPYSTLFVEDFEMTDPKAGKRKKAHLLEMAPMKIGNQIVEDLGPDVFDSVHRGSPEQPTPASLVLRGEITQYKPGSEAARLMLAGAGSAHLDFVAQLIDGETGEEIVSFSGERTWAWGGSMGASRDIGALEKNVAYEIALYIEECKKQEGREGSI